MPSLSLSNTGTPMTGSHLLATRLGEFIVSGALTKSDCSISGMVATPFKVNRKRWVVASDR